MTDHPSDSDAPDPRGPRPARPKPVAASARPTPVRSSLAAGDEGGEAVSDAGGPDPAVTLEVDGASWWVRVVGRAQGGPASAPLPLLLLGFFQDEDGAAPQREALVVARSLEGLSAVQMEEAFRSAQSPPDPDAPRKPLFPEIGSKGNRRDG